MTVFFNMHGGKRNGVLFQEIKNVFLFFPLLQMPEM